MTLLRLPRDDVVRSDSKTLIEIWAKSRNYGTSVDTDPSKTRLPGKARFYPNLRFGGQKGERRRDGAQLEYPRSNADGA